MSTSTVRNVGFRSSAKTWARVARHPAGPPAAGRAAAASTFGEFGCGQQALNADADILKKYPGWTITIEGHCDERGTAEYNLALGERRALAAKTYLVSLGIPADRLRTVSYGKEFPFDPGHSEDAWSKNRRAHFVVTSK